MQKAIYSKNYKELCDFLRARRKRLKLRQEDLAKKIETTRHMIGEYESGQRRLDVVEFFIICEALEIDACDTLRKWEALCI